MLHHRWQTANVPFSSDPPGFAPWGGFSRLRKPSTGPRKTLLTCLPMVKSFVNSQIAGLGTGPPKRDDRQQALICFTALSHPATGGTC